MVTVGNTLRTALGVTLLLVGIATSAWGQAAGGGFSFGGEFRGITQFKGRVVCVGCSLEEVQAAQPHLTNLYELQHVQGRVVMRVDAINERDRWESILGLSDRIAVRTPDRIFRQLTAEENLFKEVGIVGLLRNTRTLDIGDVMIFGPSLVERAYVAGERTQVAAARAEAAARRAEVAADQADMFADQAERTAQRIDAMVEKMEYQSMTEEYRSLTREDRSLTSLRRALRLRYARQHGGF